MDSLSDDEKKLLVGCYRVRRIEQTIASLYSSDKFQSPVHLSDGQEDISVCLAAALSDGDYSFGTYRSHALYLARGGCLKQFFAELMGKESGFAQGKAGSMHLAFRSSKVMGSSAIVGSTIPHSVGLSLGHQMQNKVEVVTAVMFGEGATNQGVFHESLNFASLHNLPMLFVCENNGQSIFTKSSEQISYNLKTLVESYAIPYFYIGLNRTIGDLFHSLEQARSRALSERRPVFLEIETCRLREHVGPSLSPSSELTPRQKKFSDDFDKSVKAVLNSSIVAQVESEISEALEFAENAEFAGPDLLLRDIR